MNTPSSDPSPKKSTDTRGEHQPPEPAHPASAALVVLIMIALGVGLYFLIMKLHDANALQQCMIQGRTNCVAMPPQ